MYPLTGLSPEDARSWRMNEAALDAASADWPRAAVKIRNNLARLSNRHAASPDLVRQYEDLVDRGPEILRAEVLSLTDKGQSLRSLHPLAGLIDRRRRHVIIHECPLR